MYYYSGMQEENWMLYVSCGDFAVPAIQNCFVLSLCAILCEFVPYALKEPFSPLYVEYYTVHSFCFRYNNKKQFQAFCVRP